MSTQNSPTRFKNALTWPETQSITSLLHVNTIKPQRQHSKGCQYNRTPHPPAFDCWTPNNPPADRSRPGLYTHASLDGAPPPPPPPLGFKSLAWPGFGLRPNPGENLATTFLRNHTDIKAKNPPVQQIVPSLTKTCNSRGTLSARVLERCQLPTGSDRIRKNVTAVAQRQSQQPELP